MFSSFPTKRRGRMSKGDQHARCVNKRALSLDEAALVARVSGGTGGCPGIHDTKNFCTLRSFVHSAPRARMAVTTIRQFV